MLSQQDTVYGYGTDLLCEGWSSLWRSLLIQMAAKGCVTHSDRLLADQSNPTADSSYLFMVILWGGRTQLLLHYCCCTQYIRWSIMCVDVGWGGVGWGMCVEVWRGWMGLGMCGGGLGWGLCVDYGGMVGWAEVGYVCGGGWGVLGGYVCVGGVGCAGVGYVCGGFQKKLYSPGHFMIKIVRFKRSNFF